MTLVASSAKADLLLLSSAVLTAEGIFEYCFITSDQACELIRIHHANGTLDCYLGHPGTVEFINRFAEVELRLRREQALQDVGQQALIVRLKRRPPAAGEVDELDLSDLSFGLIVRTA